MAYEGPEYWYVIYKAVADFGDLMRDAAKAKQELQGMADAVKAETAAEVAGTTKAAEARKADIAAIQQESIALSQLAASAKSTNVQLLYGGRNDMQQHLSDMAAELQYQTLLNRAQWLGFSTVQQAMAYRQQMYQQKLLSNKADFAGYLTADQYLAYLQKQISSTSMQAVAIKARASAVQDETAAMLAYDNAVQGTHLSVGQLGEGISAATSYASALTGLPDLVVTKAAFDDSGALAQIAAYRAALTGLPHAESVDIISAATRLGGIPLSGERARVPIETGGYVPGTLNALAPAGEYESAWAGLQRALSGLSGAERNVASQNYMAGLSRSLSADEEEADALGEALQALNGAKAETTAEFSDAPARAEVERYKFLLDELPELEIVDAEFVDDDAERDLHRWMGELMSAVRDRYAFYAELDDEEALTSLEAFVARVREAMGEEERLFAGGGGRAGGGGGGPPPPPVPPAGGGGPGDIPEPNPEDAAAWDALGDATRRAGFDAHQAAADLLAAAQSADNAADAARYAYAAQAALRLAEVQAAAAAADNADKQGAAGAAMAAMVDPLVAATGGWFNMNAQLRIFGGLLGTVSLWHVVLDAIIELLAIIVPAIVTLVAGLGAFILVGNLAQDTLGRISDRLKATYTAATATGQSIYPVTNAFDKMATVIRPEIWQLYGDALTLAGGKISLIGQLATGTGGVLDKLAARVVVWAQNSSRGIETFFQVGAHDLAGLGQFFSNLGNAFLNLIKVTQTTHVDQVFLGFLIALSKLLDLITKLPTPLLAFVVGLHAVYLWGGLASTIVLQLLGPLRSLALALGGVAAEETALGGLAQDAPALQRLKAGLQDIAAGFGAIPARISGTGKAAEEATVAVDDMGNAVGGVAADAEEAAAKSGGFGAALSGLLPLLGNVWVDLGLLAAALIGVSIWLGTMPDQTQKWIESLDSALSKTNAFTVVSQTVGDLAAVTQQLAVAQSKGVGNATELANAQADLNTKLGAELTHVGQISSLYGTSFVGALELLNTAGVKTTDIFSAQGKVWAADLQQVQGLVKGYQAMGQGLTELQQDVNVQLVANSDQLKSMQQLNQAWDSFTQLVAAPVNSFLTLDSSLNTFEADATAAGAAMSGLGTNALTAAGNTAKAAPSISNAAIQLQQQFQTVFANVESVFDAMRNSEAITGSGGFAQVVRYAVQVLIPLAGSNKAAAAEISSLAQEAGGPATTNLQSLAKWAGNSKDPLLNLYNAAEQATIGTSDLSADAQRLTTALQQDLQPAMANAIFQAHGGQQVFNDFATSLAKSGPNSAVTVAAARSVATELLAVSGNSANAKAQFIGFAEASGLSAKQAQQLWQQATAHMSGNLKDVRDSLATTAGAIPQLARPGLWGETEHRFMEAAKNGSLFEVGILNAIPGVADALGKMNAFIVHFAITSGKDIAGFFTKTIPDAARSVGSFFAGPFATSVEGAWAHVWSALVSPVAHAFDSVKSAITTGFDGWWAHHGTEVEDIGRALWRVLGDIFSGGGHFLLNDAKVFWNGLEQDFRIGANIVSGLWRAFWSFLTSLGRAFWQLFGPIVKSGWDIIVAVFRIAAGVIEAGAKALWDGLTTLAKVFWAGLEAIVKIAWDTIVAIFSVALDLITGHWSQAWTDIENFGKQIWNAISSFFTSAFGAFRSDFDGLLNIIKSTWAGTWSDIESAAKQVWNALKGGFDDVVGSIKTTWDTLEGIFKGPVSFLVNTVYDSGIARLWNDVMGAIGGPKLPTLKFAGGGRLPGYGGGDIVPAWIQGGGPALLEPGEAVVDKDTTRRYSWLLKAMGVPGFQGGGVVGDITGFFTGAAHDFVHLLGDAFDVGKIVAALVTGNTTALGNALEKFIGSGSASGELAQLITGIPKAFIHQLLSTALSAGHTAAAALGPAGAPPPGSSSAVVALRQAASRYGWGSGAEWNALNYVEMAEAGYSIIAKNPGSGAYGLAQFINGPSEYYQYGGNPNTAWGQAVAMVNYIKQRYGDPIAAAAHEAADHWYHLGGPVTASKFASGGQVPKGMDSAQAWTYFSRLLPGAYRTQSGDFWSLNAAKLPTGKGKATPAQWAGWYADLLIMQGQQNKVNQAWQRVSDGLNDPTALKQADWTTLLNQLGIMKQWEYGYDPPRSTWGAELGHPWPKGYHPGRVRPSGYAGWKWENNLWGRANSATEQAIKDTLNAATSWSQLYGGATGAGHLTGTPGVLVTLPGTSPFPVNLDSLIPAGPGTPSRSTGPSASATGMGFAGGGLVGDVASMFALSVPSMPTMASAVSQNLQRQLTGATAQPRTVAEAAGDRIGVKVGALTINNPVPEKPSDTIARSSNRLAFLAGRGPV